MNVDVRDQFTERWLDEALRHYSEFEPRAGFEGRILAGLARQKVERVPAWLRFVWVGVACTAALALVVNLAVLRKRERPAAKPPVAAITSPGPRQEHLPGSIARNSRPRMAGQRPHAVAMRAVAARAFEPRQPQFPAAAPPTQQERLLAAYVSATPVPELLAVAADQQAWRDQVQDSAEVIAPEPAGTGEIDRLQALPLEGDSTEAGALSTR